MTTDQDHDRSSSARGRIVLVVLLAVSGASTLFGFRALLQFDETPGTAGSTPGQWPRSTEIRRVSGGIQLLVFLHPQCGCSSATLNELARIPAQGKPGSAAPEIHILFYRPRNSGWTHGNLWEKAEQLPGATVQWDEGGGEAHRFGAATSGFALLYGPEGDLLFKGGVTGARGHEGTNYGVERLIDSLSSGKRIRESSFVFGCALGGDIR